MPISSKPKVLIAANSAWNIVNFREGLVRGLMDAGYDVACCAPPDGSEPDIEAMGCRFIALPMDNKGVSPARDAGLFLRFMRLLWRERPDVLLGFTVKPNVYGSFAAHLFRIPVVNNISGLGTAFIRNTWLTHVVKLLYRLALRSSSTVFFQNADDAELFVRLGLVRREQTSLLPGSGINLEKFNVERAPTAETGGVSFLLVARMLWDKGVGEFVDAARIVRSKEPDTRFQLLGFLDAENRTAIPGPIVDGWVREGIVDYLGDTADVRPFIAASNCVVLPSYREGTPRTLLEAAAMGKPLIATDVPGCREVVDHERNGLLCDVRDADDLADKLLNFLALSEEERSRMGARSREKAETEFDEEIVVRRYLSVISELLQTGASTTV